MAKKHRGRIQAQGGGTEKSVNWAQNDPLTKKDGLKLLNELKGKLTKKEFKLREKQFKDAARFIKNADQVDAHVDIRFQNRKSRNIRVDIEILAGVAFICFLIFVILFVFIAK